MIHHIFEYCQLRKRKPTAALAHEPLVFETWGLVALPSAAPHHVVSMATFQKPHNHVWWVPTKGTAVVGMIPQLAAKDCPVSLVL